MLRRNVYSLEVTNTNEREGERERKNSARSAPLIKRLKRGKSLFLSLFLSSSLALTKTTTPPLRKNDLIFLLPLNGDRRRLRFLSFSRLVSSKSLEKLDNDRAFRDTRDQREVLRILGGERKTKRRNKRRNTTNVVLRFEDDAKGQQKDEESPLGKTSLMRAKKKK